MFNNNKSRFIVLEGLDGAGKSTQIKLLQEYLDSKNIKYKYLHFPRTDAPYFGELVARFLRGEFGKADEVDPYIVAMLYAGDRHYAKEMIEQWLATGHYVIIDRYVYSNIGFQCAKTEKAEDKERLKQWILDLEYKHFKIPQPDISLFLDVPLSFTEKKLKETRTGDDREYLKGKEDIHEASIDFQVEVRKVYMGLAKEDKNFKIVDCKKNEKEILKPEEIFERLIAALESYL